ncbi:prepilin-type N-terminal cleavage/methylation domain-containing protein [Trichlorobacter sp.]|uniref:prepilin-type N-terminal cleavage/methylation domain-containing protein n=1 Tax=Trichlorobacter sp. TaxID=2911007 RepID=UPI002A365216|nr:prepilin-type N-terminal cleavage/methylation domain-containing protein [Trichlorobacter sp.]MDY0383409.1 prepilin-type N-terminal cleavage/methylation domain-containing protein [Trichlorobacter sp.]
MLNKIRNRQGFTLIELLIVVAIIGILAAVAIPQFAAYRQRGFNAAAVSDLKNGKAAEEAMFNDNGGFGKSQGPAGGETLLLATAGVAPVPATGIIGPMVGATGTVPGAMISGPDSQGAARGVAVSVSNGVTLVATLAAIVPPALSSASYSMASKHLQGSRVFSTESENTAVMFVENTGTFVGQALSATGAAYTSAIVATTNLDVTNATPGNGNPVANWAAM